MTMENKIVKVYVLKGLNGISLVIENYRVSNEKIYGMLTPIYTFEVATDDILRAIGQEYNQSDDCVSRQATLDAIIKKLCIKDESYLLQSEKVIYNVVKNMSPVTPTRKVGKWIYNRDIQNWECSECSETPKTLGYVGTSAFMTEHFKFCNHCGAVMRGCENG